MPFDRAKTAMAGFPLCAQCQDEYDRPTDRRFHAQVMACPECGPSLCFRFGSHSISDNQDAIASTVEALRAGAIVAVKGIGGYHLLCDAGNDAAVRRLRARKRRPTKPLAVLFPRAGADLLDMLRRYCAPDAEEIAQFACPGTADRAGAATRR
ncbi:MAG: Sua5/YciO/YrdC/YwlC family protein [Acetobacteraceae bacterium]